MRYTVEKTVFSLNPKIRFGILVGRNITNSETSYVDEERLRAAELKMRTLFQADKVRELVNVAACREIMT